MCRIVGIWDTSGNQLTYRNIVKMRDIMRYGGPDDAGIYIDKDSGIGLGHRRLTILDLSNAGHQPMKFDNLVIVYNGEVYNFRQIRRELEKEGYNFKSTTDTEVVLKAYHRWGLNCVHKFRGMFAFAIWDKNKKELILCRDRIGVKPLYWYYKNGIFMFASELKAFYHLPFFKKEINEKALSLFFQYGYITAPFSIFKYTYKLEPGHFLIVNRKMQIKKLNYWNLSSFFYKSTLSPMDKNEEEILEELENILTESFKLRMVADVPIGVFLSGGIDSTLVTTLLQKEYSKPLKTFTIGFYEEEYNEAIYAKQIAKYLGTDHTELYCTYKEAIEVIPKLPFIYDEPFGDSSAIPTFLVAKLAKTKVKVSLSADGGDEQFLGYTMYKKFDYLKKLTWLKNKFLYNKLININFLNTNFINYKLLKLLNMVLATNVIEKYESIVKFFLPYEIPYYFNLPIVYHFKELSRLQNLPNLPSILYATLRDLYTYLPDDILVKVDRATMHVSLEGRDPLLDHKILEFSASLPLSIKYKKNVQKYLLKRILLKYIPPNLILRPKHGFAIPITLWLKRELKELVSYYILTKCKKEDIGIFKYKNICSLVKYFLEGRRGINEGKIWLILIFEMWKEKWL